MRLVHKRGQATTELALALPVLFLVVFGGIQLCWIFWQQQHLNMVGSHVLREGTIEHGQKSLMERTLVKFMAGLKAPESDLVSQAERVTQAVAHYARQRLHFQLAGRLTILQPTSVSINAEQEQRFDPTSGKTWQEIPVDHATARLAESDQPEQWLAARQLEVEIIWCMPLQIPLASQMIQAAGQSWWAVAQSGRDKAAWRFCQLRQAFFEHPLWPLYWRGSGTMLSGYKVS